jgi:predicted PurR-regulated permease PerM
VFWNFVLGPVGIVLAVPLTITLRRLVEEYAPEVRQALTE